MGKTTGKSSPPTSFYSEPKPSSPAPAGNPLLVDRNSPVLMNPQSVHIPITGEFTVESSPNRTQSHHLIHPNPPGHPQPLRRFLHRNHPTTRTYSQEDRPNQFHLAGVLKINRSAGLSIHSKPFEGVPLSWYI